METIATTSKRTFLKQLRVVLCLMIGLSVSIGTGLAQDLDITPTPNVLRALDLGPVQAGPVAPHADASTVQGDEQWISQWSTPGIDLYGLDMVMSDAGLVIGGQFVRSGDQQVGSVALYDPISETWHDMADGVTNFGGLGTVWALAASGDQIYVGGDFDNAGGVAANNIAIYNTTTQTWSALGDGVDDSVYAIFVSGSTVYVGGDFDNAGGAPAAKIAAWNGSAWSTLGTGMNNDVRALTVFNSELYAGGDFTTAGGVAASRVARWNGLAWNDLNDGVGEGFDDSVTSFASDGSMLYIGGSFAEAGGIPGFNNIASWNSSTNSYGVLGTGFTNDVIDIVHDGSSLFATGVFKQSGINDVNFIAEWNGTTWQGVGGGLWGSEFSGLTGQGIVHDGSDIYVSGFFAGAGNTPAIGVARWDTGDSSWNSLGNGRATAPVGIDGIGIVWTVAAADDGLYVGGQSLEYAGAEQIRGIGFWDATTMSWHEIGGVTSSGETGFVQDILVMGDDVYVAGEFDQAGSVPANNIAVYHSDTDTWSALGDGTDDRVNALLNVGSAVYAGGSFSMAGGNAAANIAVWNGSTWSALGAGVDNDVYALAQYNNEIYAGGRFLNAGGNPATNIAKWNGVSWASLDDGVVEGVEDDVRSLVVAGDSVLYLGGFFDDAGSVTGVNGVASWRNDTSTFSAIGTGFDGPVYSVHMGPDDQLYAAGVMTNSGLTAVNNVALWNGSAWEGLGSGTDYQDVGGGVVAIETSANGNDLYFGGVFAFAGGKEAHNLARYNLAPNTAVEDGILPSASSVLVVESYPNPFSTTATIGVTMEKAGRATVTVYDILGRQVATVADEAPVNAGSNSFTFDGSNLQSGVYFYRVETSGKVASGLMTLVR